MKQSKLQSGNLYRTVFIYATSFVLVLMALISVFTIGPMYQRLTRAEEAGLVHMAETRAVAVGEWVLRARALALQIAGRTPMRDQLEAYDRGEISLSELVGYSKPRLMDALLLADELVGISRFDRNRKLVVQSGVPLLEDSLPQFPKAGQTFHLGPPQYIGGNPYGVVVVEVKDSKGKLLGTDILLMDTERLEKIVRNPGERDRDIRTIIGFSRDKEVRSFFPLKPEGEGGSPAVKVSEELVPLLEAAFKGETGLTEVGERIVAYAPVEGTSWGCLVETDKTQFRTPVVQSLIRAFSGILIFLVVGLLVMWSILKPAINRIFKQIKKLEQEITFQAGLVATGTRERDRADSMKEAIQDLNTAILDRVPDPVIVYNLEGRVTHLNPAFTSAFGWGPDECLGRKLDYVPPGQKPEPEQLADLLEDGGHEAPLETRRYNKKGRLVQVSLRAVYRRNEKTGLGGAAAVFITGPGSSEFAAEEFFSRDAG